MRALLICIWTVLASPFWAEEFILASTTSTQNSGLYDHLLPMFEADTGIKVKVIAVGTGQAIRIAKNGDADALLVHHRPSEDAFLNDGFGSKRFDVMYNDFVIVGPSDDPAGLQGATDLKDAMSRLIQTQAPFISRGDESGTHSRELSLWAAPSIMPKGEWYREIGAGMGAALNMAAAVEAYTLSDRGTWLSFGNKSNLTVLYERDRALLNPYGLLLLNQTRFPHVNVQGAAKFAEWITSPKGQKAIGDFRVGNAQLFCPNANNEQAQDNNLCPAQGLLE